MIDEQKQAFAAAVQTAALLSALKYKDVHMDHWVDRVISAVYATSDEINKLIDKHGGLRGAAMEFIMLGWYEAAPILAPHLSPPGLKPEKPLGVMNENEALKVTAIGEETKGQTRTIKEWLELGENNLRLVAKISELQDTLSDVRARAEKAEAILLQLHKVLNVANA